MATRYLTKEQIIRIHRELIGRYGGLHGVRDQALLESAIGRYQSGYYADVIEEAAALLESLGVNHPFYDGNKRIAVNATLTFLIINGYRLLFDEKQLFDFLVELFESRHFSFAALDPWLRKSVVELIERRENLGEEGEYAVLSAIKTCLEALENFLSNGKKLTAALKNREAEMDAIKSQFPLNKNAGSRLFINQWISATQRITSLFKRAALDINEYSLDVDSEGSKFLQGWATTVQWVEDHIPSIKGKEDLIRLSDQFGMFKNSISEIRSGVYSIPEGFQPLLQAINGLPPTAPVNKSSIKRLYKQLLTAAQDLKTSIEYCTKSRSNFDEQLSITIDSCDRIMAQVNLRMEN